MCARFFYCLAGERAWITVVCIASRITLDRGGGGWSGRISGHQPDKLRLVYVVLALFSGGIPFLVLYLVLWFLMPQEPSIRGSRVHDQL